MKKVNGYIKILTIILSFTLISLILTACDKNTSGSIYFELDGNTYYHTETQSDGTFTLPDDPIIEDGEFLGWHYFNDKNEKVNLEGQKITDASFPLVLYANYVKYSVAYASYNLNGGINNSSNPSKFYNVNVGENAILLNSPMRKTLLSTEYSIGENGILKTQVFDEYVFEGWFLDQTYENSISKLDYSLGDVTLYAKWSSSPIKKTYQEEQDYFKDGNLLYMGAYPKSLVTNAQIITKLNNANGSIPTATNLSNWTAYDFYVSGTKTSYAFYRDAVLDGKKYRAIHFNEYRPANATYAFSNSSTQKANGYVKNTTYWFEFKPIVWNVLKTTEEEMLVFSKDIIDCVSFNAEDYTSQSIFLNNYEHSYVRSFLNSEFLTSSFTLSQRELINVTHVDNSIKTSFSTPNPYICADTEDKIFLLSYKDLINPEYGFNSSYSNLDVARRKTATDYANALGIRHSTDDYSTTAAYWLRTHFFDSKNVPHIVRETGYSTAIFAATEACIGLAPAMNIKLTF